jgi:hypothetical protein
MEMHGKIILFIFLFFKKTGQVRLADFFKQTVENEQAVDRPLLTEQRKPAIQKFLTVFLKQNDLCF